RAALAQELVKTREDGRVKMYLIRESLAYRARRRALFETGDYRPLEMHGAWAEHVCAFARVGDGGAALTVTPRLLARRGPDTLPHGLGYWADTWLELPADLAGRYTNVLTGGSLETEPVGAGAALPVGAGAAPSPGPFWVARRRERRGRARALSVHRLRRAPAGARSSRHRRARAARTAGGRAGGAPSLTHTPAPSRA